MGELYYFLCLSVGCLNSVTDYDDRSNLYYWDIVYAINNVLGFKKAKHYIKKVESAYLGTSISKKNFDNFRKNNLIRKNYFAIKDFNQKKAAKLIASGETIVFCNGKMEFGARALGARSFLSDPSNLKAKKKIK